MNIVKGMVREQFCHKQQLTAKSTPTSNVPEDQPVPRLYRAS